MLFYKHKKKMVKLWVGYAVLYVLENCNLNQEKKDQSRHFEIQYP